MNTFWVHKNWKWKKENATAKYIDAQCEEAVTLADAQATIAALEETILKMGENAAVVAKDAMAAKEQIAALQAERDEYKTMYACLTGETYDNPIADLKAQLTQRTAELEAAKAIQAIDLKNNNAYREQVANLQAELERVRGEHNKAGEKLQREVNTLNHLLRNVGLGQGEIDGMAADIEELTTLRTLIAALPAYKDVSVSHRINENDYGSWHVWVDHNPLAECDTEDEADAIKALYEHRQGMEG